MILKIKDYVKTSNAILYEDGERCKEQLIKLLNNYEKVAIDFTGIDNAITVFLNPLFGDLILSKGKNIIERIDILNTNDTINEKISIVLDGALIKYVEKTEYEQ